MCTSLPRRYVSRKHPTDNKSHEILGVQQVKPAELAQQMTLDIGNAWGVLHAIIDTCLEQPPGKYLIMKDPNQVGDQQSLNIAKSMPWLSPTHQNFE